MIGVSAGRLRAYLRAGVLSPEKGTRGELRFSFQDLLLLRKAEGLVSQRIPPHRVRRALKKLRERLPDDAAADRACQLGTDGPQVVVHERGARWQVESGQVLLAFDRPPTAEESEAPLVDAAARARRRSGATAERGVPADGRGDYELGCDLDEADPEQAEASYRQVLDAGARARRRAHQPGAHPARARRPRPPPRSTTGARWRSARGDATAQLQPGRGARGPGAQHAEALEAYQRRIAADERNADAHYNAARLYDWRATTARRCATCASAATWPASSVENGARPLAGARLERYLAANAGESLRAFVPVDPRRR